MEVKITDFVKGAQSAQGVVVVIDVFRAFSTACYLFSKGVEKIFPVGKVETAFKLREKYPNSLLVGERGGKMLDGFDLGNSPTQIESSNNLKDKIVIHTTHAGTQGLVNASNADVVFTGALVNSLATVKVIKSMSPKIVTLVRMGLEAKENSDEDDLCAQYLKSLLTNQDFNQDEIEPILRSSPYSKRFFDKDKPWSPSSDFDLCLKINRFDFALKARRNKDNHLYLEPIHSL